MHICELFQIVLLIYVFNSFKTEFNLSVIASINFESCIYRKFPIHSFWSCKCSRDSVNLVRQLVSYENKTSAAERAYFNYLL